MSDINKKEWRCDFCDKLALSDFNTRPDKWRRWVLGEDFLREQTKWKTFDICDTCGRPHENMSPIRKLVNFAMRRR